MILEVILMSVRSFMRTVISLMLVLTLVPLSPAHAESCDDFIKWIDFDVTYGAMSEAMELDISTYGSDAHINWIELLALLGAKYGGDYSKFRQKDLAAAATSLQDGAAAAEITENPKLYAYYFEAYCAVLGGFLGEYSIKDDSDTWTKQYGLKVFSPIAAGFGFNHYDDFGAGRSYGFRRRHLGHDLFGSIGTPIIAVESGIVEVMGWNQYGGWRIGIRSFDGLRYHYYAHLRQNRPFHENLKEGDIVKAGDVIGYMGHTGYSANENVNGIKEVHLHYGMQIIFDPSQKECDNEIWIDVYGITRLLQKNRSAVYRVAETKEFYRVSDFDEPVLHLGLNPLQDPS